MFFFDLDDFKRINDLLGHEAGDHILASVGETLRSILPAGSAIGRYGGDEYVLFIAEKDCPSDFEELGNHFP